MISVLLQSESPWQRNDAITFLIYVCVFLYQEFFLRNRLREFVPAIIASIMYKFCKSIFEIFWNEVLRVKIWKQGRPLNRASNITNFSPRFCVYKWASSLFTGIVFKFHMHVHN